ncbi:DUF4249 domain-containing protein [Flagellimonas sp. S3867]|uniref:DUF4249 domain-containing protein n=1 Tax=Flagellimonas sp. S3867 TaxID=2768063 RepID=UPI0016872D44|nr:DUF4249 domain-containing protein [Flagellimonas sp. S3867]
MKVYQSTNPRWYMVLIPMVSLIFGCIESFEPQTEVFEDALVIEATITDELKRQEVLLTRAFRFEEFVPLPETNAVVIVVDDLQNEYVFEEEASGKYISTSSFGVEAGRSYQLLVTTSSGSQYASDIVIAPQPSPIQDLSVARVEDINEGMAIFVEYEPSQTSNYYRYHYEETYKIIPPEWNNQMLRFEGPALVVVTRDREERVCFNTNVSEDTVLNKPKQSNANNVPQFQVRFIDRDNYIISHRYSILVKQLAISEASFEYLKRLDESSGADDLFSPSQPGFFSGNVNSTSNSDENVLGFFHVASVSSKRLFFNYEDFFPSEPLPPYVDYCLPYIPPPLEEATSENPSLGELVSSNSVRYHSTIPLTGEFAVVPRVCGDCTVLGDINVPEFWED